MSVSVILSLSALLHWFVDVHTFRLLWCSFVAISAPFMASQVSLKTDQLTGVSYQCIRNHASVQECSLSGFWGAFKYVKMVRGKKENRKEGMPRRTKNGKKRKAKTNRRRKSREWPLQSGPTRGELHQRTAQLLPSIGTVYGGCKQELLVDRLFGLVVRVPGC
jgi:hypothetical protein